MDETTEESDATGVDSTFLTLATFALVTSVGSTVALAGPAEQVFGEHALNTVVGLYLLLAAFPVFGLCLLLRSTATILVDDRADLTRRRRAFNQTSITFGRFALFASLLFPFVVLILCYLGYFSFDSRSPYPFRTIVLDVTPGGGFQVLKNAKEDALNAGIRRMLSGLTSDTRKAYVLEQRDPFQSDYLAFNATLELSTSAHNSPNRPSEILHTFLISPKSDGNPRSLIPLKVVTDNQSQTTRCFYLTAIDRGSFLVAILATPDHVVSVSTNAIKE